MAFSKIAGLDVTPRIPSSSMRRFSSPELISPRRMLSYQTDWPSRWSSTSGLGMDSPHERLNRLHDGLGPDASGVEELLRFARSWHISHRKSSDRRRYSPSLVTEGLEHGVADTTLGPVVLNRHQAAARFLHAARQSLAVERLHRVQVDDADAYALALQLLVGGQRLMERDAGTNDGASVVRRAAHDLQAADMELLVGVVDDRRLLARGPKEANAVVAGHLLDQLGRLVGIARVEHSAAPHGAHHREILERHLRGPVLANGHAGVRAAQPQMGPRDGGHADEVVGARQEGRERRGEAHLVAHAETHGGGHHRLLGDVLLKIAVRVSVGEVLGVGGVAHFAVKSNHVRQRVAQSLERLAIGLASGYLISNLVTGQLNGSWGRQLRRLDRLRLAHLHHDVSFAAQLVDGPGGIVWFERLAVLTLFVLEEGHAGALLGLGDDQHRLAAMRRCFTVGAVDGRQIVAVDFDRVPAESFGPRGVGGAVPAQLGRSPLA